MSVGETTRGKVPTDVGRAGSNDRMQGEGPWGDQPAGKVGDGSASRSLFCTNCTWPSQRVSRDAS